MPTIVSYLGCGPVIRASLAVHFVGILSNPQINSFRDWKGEVTPYLHQRVTEIGT